MMQVRPWKMQFIEKHHASPVAVDFDLAGYPGMILPQMNGSAYKVHAKIEAEVNELMTTFDTNDWCTTSSPACKYIFFTNEEVMVMFKLLMAEIFGSEYFV